MLVKWLPSIALCTPAPVAQADSGQPCWAAVDATTGALRPAPSTVLAHACMPPHRHALSMPQIPHFVPKASLWSRFFLFLSRSYTRTCQLRDTIFQVQNEALLNSKISHLVDLPTHKRSHRNEHHVLHNDTIVSPIEPITITLFCVSHYHRCLLESAPSFTGTSPENSAF